MADGRVTPLFSLAEMVATTQVEVKKQVVLAYSRRYSVHWRFADQFGRVLNTDEKLVRKTQVFR